MTTPRQLIAAVRNLRASVFICGLIFTTGCLPRHMGGTYDPHAMPTAPGLTNFPPAQARAEAISDQLSVVSGPLRTVTLSWTDTNAGLVTFNIYSATEPSLAAMRLRANTAATSYAVTATNPHECFAVKALRNGLESPWAEVAR